MLQNKNNQTYASSWHWCLIAIFISIFSICYAEPACLISTMPHYNKTFYLPPETGGLVVKRVLGVRFYDYAGDGTQDGWLQPVSLPQVALNGVPIPLQSIWNYQTFLFDGFGSKKEGADQYGQYFGTVFTPSQKGFLTITGTFQQVAYMSIQLTTELNVGNPIKLLEIPQESNDSDLQTIPFGCNPYLEGNPSVFAYDQNSALAETDFQNFNLENKNFNIPVLSDTKKDLFIPEFTTGDDAQLPLSPEQKNTGQIGVYRMDRHMTLMGALPDEVAPDGCSYGYLSAQLPISKRVAILRMKLPTTFITNAAPATIFGNYQVRYFSITAGTTSTKRTLPYWTVNSRLMAPYVDENGYVYLFFAPDAFTKAEAMKQGLGENSTTPPVITWGLYKGFLLGEASYGIILRYKVPNDNWVGNPKNAACYKTRLQEKPVTSAQLGEYTPEVYAGTVADFLQGKIGAVSQEEAWPSDQ